VALGVPHELLAGNAGRMAGGKLEALIRPTVPVA
jgi:hypothetical protein